MAGGRHFFHVFPSFDPGGMEVRAAMLMDALPPPDRHTVLAMSGKTGCEARAPAARIDMLPPPPPCGMLRKVRWLARAVRRLQPDLVLTYNWGSIETVLACRLVGHGALIHHEEGFGDDEVERPLRRRVWVRRLALRRAAAVVVPSAGLAKLAVDVYRVPADKVHHLANGVDLTRFRPLPPTASRPGLTVGCVANFRPEKDVPALVEAFARCRPRTDARLLLVGDGVDRARVEAAVAAAALQDRVELRGAVEDTAQVYGELDVFALSSRTEQMPLVVLEAMASGLPVVAPAVGDVARMVSPANAALITEPGDLAALTAALDTALDDPELRARAGVANRQVCVARYELRRCLQAHLDLYRAVGQKSRPTPTWK